MTRACLRGRVLLACGLLSCGTPAGSTTGPHAGRTVPLPAAAEPIAVDHVALQKAVQRSPGRLVLVNVWATWCAACVQELPDLIRLERDYASRGLDVLFLSVDPPSQRAAAARHLASLGATGPHYVKAGPDEPFMRGIDAEWRGVLPATVLFDRDLEQIAFWEGPVDYATIRAVLDTVHWP